VALAFCFATRYHSYVKIVTSAMMRALDARAISEVGIPGAVLMENAGRAVFEVVAERFGPVRSMRYHVLCGTGNNGGDGFVAARYLHLAGARVSVSLVGDAAKIAGDAAIHYRLMLSAGLAPRRETASAVKIDALIGTGGRGAPSDVMTDVIRWMNADAHPTVAVDVPSGLNADTGASPGIAARADVTVTFGYPKLGLLMDQGPALAGDIVVRDIGFPWDALDPVTPYKWLRPTGLRGVLPVRPRDAHKGSFGRLLIVGGSRGMCGAPAMSARAALRAGVGLVTIASPGSAQAVIAAKLDEAMTLPTEEIDGAFALAAQGPLLEAAGRADAVCIGPGATTQSAARQVMMRLLRECQQTMVVDADGLAALLSLPHPVASRVGQIILTPHPGEAARLLDSRVSDIQSDRIGSIRRLATRYQSVVVLKGAGTLVCDGRLGQDGALMDPDGLPVALNTTGNPGMATGGSGDSLTGIIGALVAQGVDGFEAACLGVYLHGRAGDIAAQRIGIASLTPTDLIEALPDAIRELEAVS
jgi:ADP-dependent NAD(P)H-hydrate dehydratase / NAD(P)H-hydrate epimerase